MSDKRRMYVGTQRGGLIFAEDRDRWEGDGTALEGKSISTLLATPEGVLLAGVPHDGVYLSVDHGRSWDHSLSADVRCLAIDPSHPQTLYAGTEPVHLYRSDDAGDHWRELEGLQRVPEAVQEKWWFPVYPHEPHVLTISVSPQETEVVYVGLEHGGILRSDDGGEHWQDISDGIEYLDIHMVAADPVQRNLVYAATARAFYRSEDYGRDWVLSETGLDRDYMHDFVVRPGVESTLFMTTANGTPPAWARSTKAEAAIFRSPNGGGSWTQLAGGLAASLPRMVWGIAADPADPLRLYAGLGDYVNEPMGAGGPGGGEVWASPDAGDTWAKVLDTPSPIRALCVTLG